MHRDLKPQNILIVKGRPLFAKLSDMGISKCLAGDTSSLGQHATGKCNEYCQWFFLTQTEIRRFHNIYIYICISWDL